MSKIKQLFFKDAYQENRPLDANDILKFVEYLNSGGNEGPQFDAKDICKLLNQNLDLCLDRVKVELGKHLSAFANSSGGLLAIGIREHKDDPTTPFTINPYEIAKINLQHIMRAITTAVEPRIEFFAEVVKIDDEGPGGQGRGIICIFIEQGPNPPYQVVYNRTYYFRHGESSLPAPHSLISALFHYRKRAMLAIDLIKIGANGHYRLLVKNRGSAPALHAHIIINIYPRLFLNQQLAISPQQIHRTTDGIWNIKSFLGNDRQNFMKFRFRALPGQIILPHVNEILFDFPSGLELPEKGKLSADLFCEGFQDKQEFEF